MEIDSPKKYRPVPVDTSSIELPKGLMALSEEIAKNVHDIWAQNRIKEGWSYGPERNDKLKQTPCLVPYENLPEVEKDYDRNTAMATLKLIYKLGFEIKKKL